MFKMPWGKFKGEQLEGLPSDYLRWLATNCEDDEIATLADEEFRERTDDGTHFWED